MDPNFLEFEQPIAELEAKISELRYVTDDSDINITEEIGTLEKKVESFFYLFQINSLADLAVITSPQSALHARLY